MMRSASHLALLLLLSGCALEAPPAERLGQASQPVFDGRLANTSEIYSTVSVGDSCTGTLIAPTVVLSAAHCIEDDAGNTIPISEVTVGALRIGQGEPYGIVKATPHGNYDPNIGGQLGASNDVAVLVLEDRVTEIPVAPVLPLARFDEVVTPGTLLTVSGFGQTGDNPDNDALHLAETPFVSRNDTEFHAGGAGQPDTCPGDSGGPAYIFSEGTRYVLGATSRAFGDPPSDCQDAGGIYALAAAHDVFIRNNSNGAWPPTAEELAGTADDGGCSVSGVGSSRGARWAWIVAAALGWSLRRRREAACRPQDR